MNRKSDDSLFNRLKRGKLLGKLISAGSILVVVIMSVGFYFFIDYFHSIVFKNPDFNDDSSIVLKPYGKPDDGLMIRKAKIVEKGFDYRDSGEYLKARSILESYYKDKISKVIGKKLVAGSLNICRIDYDISSQKTTVPFCDDYVFKRSVELSLSKVPPFNKDLNLKNVDIKKISFDYKN